MDTTLINSVTAKFSAVDFSPYNARHAELSSKLAEVEGAVATADARRDEIHRILSDYREPAGEEIAAALLDGKSASEAASIRSSPDELRAELDGLSSAVRTLNQQATEIRLQIRQNRDDALSQLGNDVDDVVARIVRDASDAAQRIANAYASVTAINLALDRGRGALNSLTEAMEHLAGAGRLLPYRHDMPVPPEIVAMIAALQNKGPAVRVHQVATARAP